MSNLDGTVSGRGDQRRAKIEAQLAFQALAPLVWRQRRQQLQADVEVLDRLGVGEIQGGALPGQDPEIDGLPGFSGGGKMLRQKLGPGRGNSGEIALQRLRDTPVRGLPVGFGLGLIGRFLNQGDLYKSKLCCDAALLKKF